MLWTRFSGVERRMIMPCRAGAAGTLYRNTSGGVGRYLAEASANGHSSTGYSLDTLLHSEACCYTGDLSLLNFQQAVITCHGRHMSACLGETSESLIGRNTVPQQVPSLVLRHESGGFKHSYVAWCIQRISLKALCMSPAKGGATIAGGTTARIRRARS